MTHPAETAGWRAAHWLGALFAPIDRPFRAPVLLVVLALLFLVPGVAALPPMDRDEPRFAQATKQMLETRDFVDIRFQDEARHKKPVGIYWLQAAAVSAGEALGVPDARRVIALYRIPSQLGALLMVLATYFAARVFVSRRGAFFAALLMLATLLLGAEARLAKTDAMLSACIVAAMGIFARVALAGLAPANLGKTQPADLPLGLALLFWAALGLGILIKGPIAPMVVGFAALWLVARERSAAFLLPLRPWLGLAIVLAIVLPWGIAILAKSGLAFLDESLGKDMFGKVAGGQEKHGAPPGTYVAVFWVVAWPLAPLAGLALPFAWRERRDDALAVLFGWVIPSWLVFEAVPTKLPHYILPLLPAFAILLALAIERRFALEKIGARILAFVLLLAPVLFAGAVLAGYLLLEEGGVLQKLPFAALPFLAVAVGFALWAGRALWRYDLGPAFVRSMVAALALGVAAFPFAVPGLSAIGLSPRLARALDAAGCSNPEIATVGYREPSLVFLTETRLAMPAPAEAAALLSRPGEGCRIAFIEKRDEPAFLAALPGASPPALVTRVRGVNINGAVDKAGRLRVLDIGVYVRR